jgi:hypothetical protein
MPPVGFELAIPGSEQLQTYVLDRAAIWLDINIIIIKSNKERDTLYYIILYYIILYYIILYYIIL